MGSHLHVLFRGLHIHQRGRDLIPPLALRDVELLIRGNDQRIVVVASSGGGRRDTDADRDERRRLRRRMRNRQLFDPRPAF
jgi:hypothetical protein